MRLAICAVIASLLIVALIHVDGMSIRTDCDLQFPEISGGSTPAHCHPSAADLAMHEEIEWVLGGLLMITIVVAALGLKRRPVELNMPVDHGLRHAPVDEPVVVRDRSGPWRDPGVRIAGVASVLLGLTLIGTELASIADTRIETALVALLVTALVVGYARLRRRRRELDSELPSARTRSGR